MSEEKETLEVFLKNIIEKIVDGSFDIEKLAVIVLISDTKKHGGAAWNINRLGAVERVDIIEKLIKNFEITLDDVEEQQKLKKETRIMQKIIKGLNQ